MSKSSNWLRKRRKRLIAVGILLILVAILLDSNLRLRRVDYTVELPLLPEAFDGFVIAHLSDFHMQRLTSNRLLYLVEQAEPDIIVFTGDLSDRSASIPQQRINAIELLFQNLVAIAPTYFVTGNHDIAVRQFMPLVEPILRRAGVIVLRDDFRVISRQTADGRTQMIYIAGIDDPLNHASHINAIEQLRTEIDASADESFVILLAHRYTRLHQYAAAGFDFVLSGHSHGGGFRLPFIGPIFSTDRTFLPHNAEGLSRSHDTVMVTSRGIASWIPPRFNNNPEVVIIKLVIEN